MTNEEHMHNLAESLAGNFLKFDSFAMREKPEDPERWCIVYTHNRDSGITDRSNAYVIREALKPYLSGEHDLCRVFEANHWAVGWVSGYLMRIFTGTDGELTPWFKAYAELAIAMEDYPILDENHHSELEREDADETWSNCYNEQERLVHLRDHWSGYRDCFASVGGLLTCVRGGFAPWSVHCGFEHLNLTY